MEEGASEEFSFLYSRRDEAPDLLQGDLISRTPPLRDRIAQAHPYYAETDRYVRFAVVTQTCDLVRRKETCKAPYITLVAVRTLEDVARENLTGCLKNIQGSSIKYLPRSAQRTHHQFLERILHNTSDEYFFYPKSENFGVEDDLVACLRLSIALRLEHYEEILKARTCGIADVFQAKLGWLKGAVYSRVATPAFEEEFTNPKAFKTEFLNRYTEFREEEVISPDQADWLIQEVKLGKSASLGDVPPPPVALATQVVRDLENRSILSFSNDEERTRTVNRIANLPVIKKKASV